MSPHAAAGRLAEAIEFVGPADPGAGGDIEMSPNCNMGHVEVTTAAAEARTLKDPTAVGQVLTISFNTDGGNLTITADSDIDNSGNNVMLLEDAGDFLELRSAKDGSGGYHWRLCTNIGATLS